MKIILLSLMILVLLFGGSVSANQCDPEIIDHKNNYGQHQSYRVISNPVKTKLINDIFLESLKWRKPDLKFSETTGIDPRLINSPNYYFLSVYSSNGERLYRQQSSTRWGALWQVTNMFTAEVYPIDFIYPVLPAMIKSAMDFSCLPIGFKILNPDNGLIEERWDGSSWLRPNQLSTVDLSLGGRGITK